MVFTGSSEGVNAESMLCTVLGFYSDDSYTFQKHFNCLSNVGLICTSNLLPMKSHLSASEFVHNHKVSKCHTDFHMHNVSLIHHLDQSVCHSDLKV